MADLSTPRGVVEAALDRLAARPGYVAREGQAHLALLISDMLEDGTPAAFEAPTGLGKSLAILLPALAHGALRGRRTVVATYTNVLSEQYWRKDLPLARSLLAEIGFPAPEARFLIGRARYVCLLALGDKDPRAVDELKRKADLGVGAELRQALPRATGWWAEIQTPPVCPARACPLYEDCFYYRARREAEAAPVVVTNHAVVVQDAVMKGGGDEDRPSTGMLGEYDRLLLDEAHDFPSAAQNGLEFELSPARIGMWLGAAKRLESAGLGLEGAQQRLEKGLESIRRVLEDSPAALGGPGVLAASPPDVAEHPAVAGARSTPPEGLNAFPPSELVDISAGELERFAEAAADRLSRSRDRAVQDAARNYVSFLTDAAAGCRALLAPQGVSVAYLGGREGAIVRRDTVDLAAPLRELLWDRVPAICLSATLAVDGEFGFFDRQTGFVPAYAETLASPFDPARDACLYLPPPGAIPDPSVARREEREGEYHAAVAAELGRIVRTLGGRTLALFSSRREMEEVARRMRLPADLPLLVHARTGGTPQAEAFKADPATSLFGLRSFWTGFDAPGETLQCVVIVRLPFEVPVDPVQIARMAWLDRQGLDPFREHTLPLAKQTLRQGAGRLLRRDGDRGVIAILDPRVRTKRYGEEMLMNLPPDLRRFGDLADALGYLGLEPSPWA